MTTCATPVSFETLLAWWTGELADDDAGTVEEHLFACDSCAAASAGLADLATGIREQIPFVISHAHRDRLQAAGARILATPVYPGVEALARFDLDKDLLVHVLRVDFSPGAERVDVQVFAAGGPILCEAVPFDAQAGEVLICCQRHYQPMAPTELVFRVHAVEGGQRRHLGDYTVRHEWL